LQNGFQFSNLAKLYLKEALMAENQGPSVVLSSTDNGEGLFLSDNSGNYYYIRPEILAQTKMSKEDVARVKAQKPKAGDRELSADDLQAVVGGSGMPSLPGVLQIGHVPSLSVPKGASMEGTVMCPW
jgi:hypothetical protein